MNKVLIPLLLSGMVAYGDDTYSNAVGYQNTTITTGSLCRVEPTFVPLNAFPTMKSILRVEPPEDLVGNQLIFDLDGKHWVYDALSYDPKEEDYRLKARRDWYVVYNALDGIPFRRVFWINNRGTKPMQITTRGTLNKEASARLFPEQKAKSNPAPLINIEVISSEKDRRHILSLGEDGISVKDRP